MFIIRSFLLLVITLLFTCNLSFAQIDLTSSKGLVYTIVSEKKYMTPVIEDVLSELITQESGKKYFKRIINLDDFDETLQINHNVIKNYISFNAPELNLENLIPKRSEIDSLISTILVNSNHYLVINSEKFNTSIEFQFKLYNIKLIGQENSIPRLVYDKVYSIHINPFEQKHLIRLKLRNSFKQLFSVTNSPPKLKLYVNDILINNYYDTIEFTDLKSMQLVAKVNDDDSNDGDLTISWKDNSNYNITLPLPKPFFGDSVTFSNLKPGNYSLSIVADDGPNKENLEINFRVLYTDSLKCKIYVPRNGAIISDKTIQRCNVVKPVFSSKLSTAEQQLYFSGKSVSYFESFRSLYLVIESYNSYGEVLYKTNLVMPPKSYSIKKISNSMSSSLVFNSFYTRKVVNLIQKLASSNPLLNNRIIFNQNNYKISTSAIELNPIEYSPFSIMLNPYDLVGSPEPLNLRFRVGLATQINRFIELQSFIGTINYSIGVDTTVTRPYMSNSLAFHPSFGNARFKYIAFLLNFKEGIRNTVLGNGVGVEISLFKDSNISIALDFSVVLFSNIEVKRAQRFGASNLELQFYGLKTYFRLIPN